MTSKTIFCPICEHDTQSASPTLCTSCGWEFLYFSEPNDEYEKLQAEKRRIFLSANAQLGMANLENKKLTLELNDLQEKYNVLETTTKENGSVITKLKSDLEGVKKNLDIKNKELLASNKKNSRLEDENRELSKVVIEQASIVYNVNAGRSQDRVEPKNPNVIGYSIEDQRFLNITFTSPVANSKEFPLLLELLVIQSDKQLNTNIFFHNADWCIMINVGKRSLRKANNHKWVFELPWFLQKSKVGLEAFLYLRFPGIFTIDKKIGIIKF